MAQEDSAQLFSSFRDVPISISESDSFKIPWGPWGPVDLAIGVVGFAWTVFWVIFNIDNNPLSKGIFSVMIFGAAVAAARQIKKGRPPLLTRVVWMVRRWFPQIVDTGDGKYKNR
ncbi:hypothetical protein [Mycobacteroides chelonae]|uniref:hypothetical protein n=1 Tax=Mycobacteroides chelonae TaxID=1774 RepID=UPI0010423ED6|nr:hypothetical protein [Mycobacteroides chelonae]